MKWLFLLFPLFWCSTIAQTNADRILAETFFRLTTKSSIDRELVRAALIFLETPYVAGTLERSEKEGLIVNLQEVDCMTLVEYCLALSRTVQFPLPDWETFEQELKQIRYRNGIINGYVSRLHYATDWIFDNVEKGIFEDVTYALGGRKIKINVSYMSENYEKYPHLTGDPEAVQHIAFIEKAINGRSNYYYIPKKEIVQHQSLIKNGDIICFTTSIAGLDISHLGIAYWNKGRLTFIHASTSAKKVIINPDSLIDYCNMIRSCTGIMVLRPVNLAMGGG
jgi:cell wall-associated NlpC family hydrolase